MESSSCGSSKRARMLSNGTQVPSCLVDGCVSDLSKCRDYHRRHKVCELHSKTPKVFIKGQEQRFCQQCSRFHSLVEFDEGKRSCRKRLDGHNRRRRKPQPDSLSINSPSLFSHHQGTTYINFGGSQVFSTTAASSNWTGAVKVESDPWLYGSQSSSFNISFRKSHFPGSLSLKYKVEKQFPFMQGTTSSAIPIESGGQSNLDANSILANSGSGSSQKMLFSNGLMPDIHHHSDCALSLLSSPPANSSREIIGLNQMDLVQPQLTTPQPLSLISSSLNYDGNINSSNIHQRQRQNSFQTEGDVSSVSGPHQMLSFSWG